MGFSNFRFILRRFNRQKLNTSLHITGLTLGISICLVIGLFINHELSYDDYHEKADRTYRVNQVWTMPSGEKEYDYSAPAPLGNALRAEIPEIETVASIFPRDERIIEINPKKRFVQNGVLFAEPEFLDVFDIEVLEGNGHEALRNPWQTLLTTSTAEKFFGRENAIGKTFLYQDKFTVTVAGIIKDLPENTHLPATMLISYSIENKDLGIPATNWGSTFGASTYIVLKEGAKPENLAVPIKAMYDLHVNTDPEDGELANADIQPLHKIHLEPKYEGGGEWVKAINVTWLWFFGIIASIVLALACINFVNLSTAQSLVRAKEVGVRKAIGAERSHLIQQFLAEAFVLIGLSTVFAIVVAQFSLPYINNLLDKNISFDSFFSPTILTLFFGGIALVGLLTGIYPAWMTSKFQPALALKSRGTVTDRNSTFLRKGLVVTQFAISGALLIALLLISQQIEFFYTTSLGFDKDNIVTVEIPDKKKSAVFAAALKEIPSVKDFTFASTAPSEPDQNGTVMHKRDLKSKDRKEVNLIFADNRYPDLFNLQLKAGRFFEVTDTSATSVSLDKSQRFPKVIVNEKLIQEMGYASPQEALNQRFKIGWNDWQPEIVGVVENFVTSTLHEDIRSTLIFQYPKYQYNAGIKIEANSDLPVTLAAIETAWKTTFPQEFYKYSFLDDYIAQYYKGESQLYAFFKIFAILAMVISCLGLWGLATFSAAQRTKEIGIRKVLGASTQNLINLLAKDFLKLVFIALLIAMPLAWYGINEWLNNFAFRIDIGWQVFVVAIIAAIGIALLTISFQSIRAALANPIESLKNE